MNHKDDWRQASYLLLLAKKIRALFCSHALFRFVFLADFVSKLEFSSPSNFFFFGECLDLGDKYEVTPFECFANMESIFHEKQEGSLCAQHCLNALLQGPYFTAPDLGQLGRQADEEERRRMAEGGTHSSDYVRFMQQPSSNVDDSGYFSVQVIASALKVWSLDLIPYSSQNPLAQRARQDPTTMGAYICHFREHWLTVRKIGRQWFNLNSLLEGPELVSHTFLALYLAQLQEEGYSIFIVDGPLPECPADRILLTSPVVQTQKPRLLSEAPRGSEEGLDEVLRQTMQESREFEDACMRTALQLSLNEFQASKSSDACTQAESEPSEQEMLERAIQMSLETPPDVS